MTDEEDFEALLADFDQRKDPRVGDRVTGKIISIGREHIFVDVGAKSEGLLEIAQVTDSEGKVGVEVGDEIESVVVKRDDRTGTLVLRTRMTGGHQRREDLEDAFANQMPIEGVVTGTNKGGLEVQISGVRAFCPISQIDTQFVENAEDHVGQRYTFLITKYEDEKRGLNLVVSRRALLAKEQAVQAEQTRAHLEVGAVLKGTVRSIKDFGAFVDIGGLEGMVHISEMGFGHVDHPQDVLSVGQIVDVAVLRIEQTGDPRRPEKIALSIRALEKDPWEDVDQRFPVGARTKGTVARLQPFGAFVEVAPGVQGLVHISELGAGRRVSHPREVVKVGDEVEATILNVDMDKRRIALSIGAARTDDEQREEREAVTSYNNPDQSLGTFGDLLARSQTNNEK